MPANCSANGCSNSGNVKFPSDPLLLQAWRVALNREGKKRGSLRNPTPYSRLCHDHFKPEDYLIKETSVVGFEKKFIRPGAVPSLKLGTTKSRKNTAPETPRTSRKRKRDLNTIPFVEVEEDPEIVLFQPELNLPVLHADLLWIGREEEILLETVKNVPSSDCVDNVRNGEIIENATVGSEKIIENATVGREEIIENKAVGNEEIIENVEASNEEIVENVGNMEEVNDVSEIRDTDEVKDSEMVGKEAEREKGSIPGALAEDKKVPNDYCIEMFENNPVALQFYTGFRDYGHFNFFFSCLEPAIHRLDFKSQKLSRKNEFFLTVMKLRCAKPNIELSIMFGIGTTAVCLVFNTMIRFLFYHLKDMTPWLPKDIVDSYTPLDFKAKYPGTRVLLDATEYFVQKPRNVKDQSATWSSYKNHSTLKSMIGITPRGVVSYVSPTFGGCTSDRQIIERSELVKRGMFEKGDSIMADRGIMVQDMFSSMDVKVNTPTMLKGRSQLSSTEVIKDRRIAAKRIHIERVIGLAKTYKILTGELHQSLRPLSDKIVFVCFALCNFRPSIVGNYA